ncbi:hypothetical protein N8927_03205 [Crocinitomicaceae bacterium]|nr:hypothetical protein [Crocinitomicaceae bacterium]
MDKQKLKKAIFNELDPHISTIDPGFNLKESIDFYFKIIDQDISIYTRNDVTSLDKHKYPALDSFYLGGSINDDAMLQITNFNLKYESFIKKTYYLLLESGLITEENTVNENELRANGPYISSINKLYPLYRDKNDSQTTDLNEAKLDLKKQAVLYVNKEGHQQYKRLFPKKLQFDEFKDINSPILVQKYYGNWLLHFLRANILKNEESHQAKTFDKNQFSQNLQSTLIAELYITQYVMDKLSKALVVAYSEKRDYSEYIDNVTNLTKTSNELFVSLNLRELTEETVSQIGFIEDIVKEIKRFRILGEGGSGKTTTMEYLVFNDCLNYKNDKENQPLPVIITLSNIGDEVHLKDAIANKIGVTMDSLDELFVTNKLKVYLDGVNEIVKKWEIKKTKIHEISSLIKEYKELSIVISDRYDFDVFQNDFFDVRTFTIQKIEKNQMNEFIQKSCFGNEKQIANVSSKLEKYESLEILSRPLILSRAIEIIKSGNNLPDKTIEIIEVFIDIILKREKNEKKDPLLNILDFKLLIGYLAHKIFDEYKGHQSIPENKCRKILSRGTEELGLESSNVKYSMRMGFELQILSKKDNMMRFYHQNYFEFFNAHYLDYLLA